MFDDIVIQVQSSEMVVAIGGKMRHANPNSNILMTNYTYFWFLYAPWDLPENCFFFLSWCVSQEQKQE